MNVIDIGIILVLCMSFLVGWKSGVIRELFNVVGIVVVLIISYQLKGLVGNALCKVLPFIKFKGILAGLTAMNILLYQAIAFLLVFGILLGVYSLLISISKFLQEIINFTIVFLLPSKILGGIIGLIRCWLVLFIIIIVLLVPFKNQSIVMESKLVDIIVNKTPFVNNMSKGFVDATEDIYTLAQKVSKKEITTNEANLKSIDAMLKYKIVDKKTVEDLQKFRKLNDIKDLDSVLKNY